MSYHLIVHLKAKGTATLWPDKVAVLHAWSRRSPSLGFPPLDRAIGRPRCSFDRGFTVTLPEPRPPTVRYAHAESGERECPVLYEYQVGTATNLHVALAIHRGELNDPVAVHS